MDSLSKTILQLLADPCHKEFVSWHVDHFQPIKFFPLRWGVKPLVEFSLFFFETFPYSLLKTKKKTMETVMVWIFVKFEKSALSLYPETCTVQEDMDSLQNI